MNKKQRTIILVRVIFIVAMILFPPWFSRYQNSYISLYGDRRFSSGDITKSAGYGLLFRPPYGATNVDTTRLLLQILGAAILAGGLFVVLKDTK